MYAETLTENVCQSAQIIIPMGKLQTPTKNIDAHNYFLPKISFQDNYVSSLTVNAGKNHSSVISIDQF